MSRHPMNLNHRTGVAGASAYCFVCGKSGSIPHREVDRIRSEHGVMLCAECQEGRS